LTQQPAGTPSRPSAFAWLGVAALIGVSASAFLAWRTVTVQRAEADDALQRFEEIRRGFDRTEPVLHVDAERGVTRRPPPVHPATPPTRLRVLAYQASAQRLVRADLPFWFVKMKGWAVGYLLRETGLDFGRLGVSPGELEPYGACLLLDETRENGDRLLVWTE
jgi:hypothetical protein